MGPRPQALAARLSALCPIEIEQLNRHIHEYVEVALPIGIFGSGGRDRTYDQLINSYNVCVYFQYVMEYFITVLYNFSWNIYLFLKGFYG